MAAQRLEAEVRRPADAEAYRKRTIAEADRDREQFAAEAEAYRKRTIAEADRDQVRLATDADAYRQTTMAEAERQQARLAADAEAYRQTTTAAADAQAILVRAEAAANAERATAQADADANTARANSLRQGNQELIAAERIVESLPALVEAAAGGLAGANLTVLNGTQGVNDVIAGLVGQGLTVLGTLRKATALTVGTDVSPSANGSEGDRRQQRVAHRGLPGTAAPRPAPTLVRDAALPVTPVTTTPAGKARLEHGSVP